MYDKLHKIIHVHVAPSAEVHTFKRVIYDRIGDSDIKITATRAIAQLKVMFLLLQLPLVRQ